jgi:UDP-2,3-diacylglucosamine hydrolase
MRAASAMGSTSDNVTRHPTRDRRADAPVDKSCPIDPSAGAPLAIICGAGSVPFAVADAVMRRGRQVVLFALRGWADAAAVEAYPHHWVALGQFGRFCQFAHQEGCRDVVLVGGLVRPPILQLRLDWGGLKQLPLIIRSFRGGDDHLLSGMGRMFENAGFHLLGAQEVAPEITAPLGALGRFKPDAAVEEDISRGFALLDAASAFDVGQAAVIAARRVLAIEAAEGTDAMLDRVIAMRTSGRIAIAAGAGVLVKAPKRRQDRRFDLPSIGPDTVTRAARAGLAGIAVVAGATIVAEPHRLVEIADHAGLFVVGRPDPETPA